MPKFNGRWIGTTSELDDAVKASVSNSLSAITETIDYDILAQNNEGSALTIMTDETYAHLIATEVPNESEKKKLRNLTS